MSSNVIICKIFDDLEDDEPVSNKLEPVFQLSFETRLNVVSQFSTINTIDFFSHKIARDPNDLRVHTQKIKYLVKQNKPQRLYGALVDLFIALGEKGYPLRKSLLESSKSTLDEENYNYFKEKLEIGMSCLEPVLNPQSSILTKGLKGSCRLVKKSIAKDGKTFGTRVVIE